MARYPRDPYSTKARFDSACTKCKAPVKKGDEIFYYPNTKSVYGSQCGHAQEAAADFGACMFDEMQYNA